MKTYIFLTIDILNFGGTQMYVSSKAEYLEKNGWNVLVLFSSYSYGNCIIPSLNKFRNGLVQGLNIPSFLWPEFMYYKILHKILGLIGDVSKNDEIIIESHDDSTAVWGEIIAEKIGAKHVFILMNEIFHGNRKYYEDKIDFYFFKLKRREIGGLESSFRQLFKDYKEISKANIQEFIIDENPIRSIHNKKVEDIVKLDWNICLISRPEKGYVTTIIKEVFFFSKKHNDKKIQFILLGDQERYSQIIEKEGCIPSNLNIIILGIVVPIPKSLFSKVDVFIAGAGSARSVTYEGGLVIVPDSQNFLSNGLLGYDVIDAIYNEDGNQQRSIAEELERVLINKVYNNMPFNFPYKNVEACTNQNFEFIYSSERKKEYYGELKLLKSNKSLPLIRLAMYYASLCFPGCVQTLYNFLVRLTGKHFVVTK